MSDKLMKTLIGAAVAVALALAVSYGLISQPTADKIQNQTNEALSDDKSASPPAPQQPAPQGSGAQAPAPADPAPQNAAPAPRP